MAIGNLQSGNTKKQEKVLSVNRESVGKQNVVQMVLKQYL